VTDPHQPATSPGTSTGDVEHRAAIAEALGKEVWPADKDTLVAKAQENNAQGRVLSDLRRLPSGQQFHNVQEVARALGMGTEQQRF
jgi:O6-methylguanine-DNA--protein-cysteine methyltransferase